MATRNSLEKAARVWCAKSTQMITMDERLAKEFARVLDRENIFRKIRRDPDLYYAWQSNIAIAFKDEFHRWRKAHPRVYAGSSVIHRISNEAAKNFLNLLIRK